MTDFVTRLATMNKYIENINNFKEEFQLNEIAKDGLLIQYINNPSLEVQKVAVCQNGDSLKHILDQTSEVIILSIHQNPEAYKHIRKMEISTLQAVMNEFPHHKDLTDKLTRIIKRLRKIYDSYIEDCGTSD